MTEFTTLEGYPIFIDLAALEIIEQQSDGTCLCTSSGKIVFVLESAAEVIFEVRNSEEERIMMGMQ